VTYTPQQWADLWPKDEYLSEADEALYDAYAAYRVDADASNARRVFLTFESWLSNREGA